MLEGNLQSVAIDCSQSDSFDLEKYSLHSEHSELPEYSQLRRDQHKRVIQEIKRTAPLGVETHRTLHYLIPLKQGALDLYVLKAFVPEEKEADLLRWEAELQRRFKISLVIERTPRSAGINHQLELLSNGRELLTRRELPLIESALKKFAGEPPTLESSHREAFEKGMESLPDKSYLKLLAIDPEYTRDREDLIGARRIPGSNDIELCVGFIDVTTFIKPGDNFDTYAKRIGKSIYGSGMVIPTLGRDAAFSLANFEEGRLRPGFLLQMTIDKSGEITACTLSRAKLKNHLSVSPDDIDLTISRNGWPSETLRTLREASKRLSHSRQSGVGIVRTDSGDEGPDIVAEAMVAAKSLLAEFLSQEKSPAIFRVHTPPTIEIKAMLAEKISALGVLCSAENLNTPVQFAAMLEKVEHSGNPKAPKLVNEILSAFLLRSRFDTENEGHFGVGKRAYMEIKPREASGLVNQFQVRAELDRNYPTLSLAELQARAELRNKQKEDQDSVEYRLRFIERLRQNLERVGERFKAEVVKISNGRALLDVPEFSRWGVLPLRERPSFDRYQRSSRHHSQRAVKRPWLESGDRIEVALKGFNLKEMRLEFGFIE